MKKGEIVQTNQGHLAVREKFLNQNGLPPNKNCAGEFRIMEIAINGVFIFALGECTTKGCLVTKTFESYLTGEIE